HEFTNTDIKNWVDDSNHQHRLLWREPFIQIKKHFMEGGSITDLIDKHILHPQCHTIFRSKLNHLTSSPYPLYEHQRLAILNILQHQQNTIVATGTGSGKSFCFGIPLISECLKMKEQGIKGIKALIIYPMNALANDQYDEFSARLEGTGLKIALYTGDTPYSYETAISQYERRVGRAKPYDCELICRQDILKNKPDILMTNYQMLELILTRFDDKQLFSDQGVLKFLVLDEVHTYSGRRGADVAMLIRRLKCHTGTEKTIRCIGTSATIQSGAQDEAVSTMCQYAEKLFGEPFSQTAIISECYKSPEKRELVPLTNTIQVNSQDILNFSSNLKTIETLCRKIHSRNIPENNEEALYEEMLKNPLIDFLERELQDIKSINQLIENYQRDLRPFSETNELYTEIMAGLLIASVLKHPETGSRFVLKIHAFFSQGRGIKATMERNNRLFTDKGEPVLKSENNGELLPAWQLLFCQSCGQDYYYGQIINCEGCQVFESVDFDDPDFNEKGKFAYLYMGHIDEAVFLETFESRSVNQRDCYCLTSINPKTKELAYKGEGALDVTLIF
ncbi:MAG TPA: DEAD/DEAH box helicase, partial [Candidatus Cloacimonadota bacterium]|nr:DEAD/DEAH box helicase [Candidatus Cloacimonadota bacterium]